MGEINEKLERAATQYKWQLCGREQHDTSFKAGAEWMRQELLRWRDPQKELPEEGKLVLLKINSDYPDDLFLGAYKNGDWDIDGGYVWGTSAEDADANGLGGFVTGWRPIHENEEY